MTCEALEIESRVSSAAVIMSTVCFARHVDRPKRPVTGAMPGLCMKTE